jgi:ABC-type transport system involved in cytochrome bd biosynthesis fused ATPase/permease subunit
MVLGDIGSGKSSLIYAILGEMKPQPGHSPSIAVAGSVALTAQKAWILSSSVEDNILMTAAKDETRLA